MKQVKVLQEQSDEPWMRSTLPTGRTVLFFVDPQGPSLETVMEQVCTIAMDALRLPWHANIEG